MCVNNVLKDKLFAFGKLVQQATQNPEEQFTNSPYLVGGILNEIQTPTQKTP